MVRPRDALEAVARAIAAEGTLPADLPVVMEEADARFEQADVEMPMLEIQIDGNDRVVVHNTDLVGFETDSNGNKIGRIYESEYELELQFDIWTVDDDSFSPDALGNDLRDALYQYSSYGSDKPFLDADGNRLDGIYYFRLVDGDRVDDLIQTPTVRRWRQTAELWACEQFTTTEEYITTVDYPQPGEFDDADADGIIEAEQT